MTPPARVPRRALAWLALALAALAAQVALSGAGPTATTAPAVAPSGAAAPGGALELFAGAFEPIVADVLWARLLALYDARRYDDVLPVASALLALDPRFEEAWWVAARTVGIDLAAFEDDPRVRWRWRRQGLVLLREGAARNPGSWALRADLGWLVQQTAERDPPVAALLEADRELDPDGVSCRALACRAYLDAARIPGHGRYVDALAAGCDGR